MRSYGVVLLLMLGGCDWVMAVDAKVTVDAATQQAITVWPQQLLLRHGVLEKDSGPAAAHRIAVLCEPAAEPFVTAWSYGRVNGCGEAADLVVWLEPLDPAAGLACGPKDDEGERVDARAVPPEGAPSAAGRVFEGGGDCPRYDALTLPIGEPVPEPPDDRPSPR